MSLIVGPDYGSIDGNGRAQPEAFKALLAQHGSTLGVVALRAAYGTIPDSTIQRDWVAWKDAGATMMGYLFLRIRPGSPEPEDQVQVAANVLGPLTEADIPLCIDVEDTGQTAQAELDLVHRAAVAARSIYGVMPPIYDSARVWHEDLHDLPAGELIDCPLWLAKPWIVEGGKIWYAKGPPELSGATFAGGKFEPPVPKPWGPGNWWMHQYQGDAKPVAGIGQCDLSRFHLMVQGETGARVTWVQRKLGLQPTGVYDAAMASRVSAFQQQKGLVVDAVIGPKTFAHICWCGGVEMPTAA